MESIVCKSKKIVFARFDEGDDLLLCLKKCAMEHGIKSDGSILSAPSRRSNMGST